MTRDRQALAATLAAAVPVAAVAVIAGLVSYSHIEALALAEHQPLALARLFPFSVDFLIVAGSVVVLGGVRLGWLAVVPGVAATLFANIESGIGYGWLAATVAGWPAIAFSVASFVLERWLKSQAGRGGTGGPGVAETHIAVSIPEPLAEPEPSQPEPVASQGGQGGPEWLETGPGNLLADGFTPEVSTEPEPAEPPAGQCGHTVAGTPEENVVRAFLHERDCLGGTPSRRRLAATYGLSRPRVAQLVGNLNGHAPGP